MASPVNRRLDEITALQNKTAKTSTWSLYDLRKAYYGGGNKTLSQNDAIRAYLQSSLGVTNIQSLTDLWRLYFQQEGITNQVSLSDMARAFFTGKSFQSNYSLLYNGTNTKATVAANNFFGLSTGTYEFWINYIANNAFQKIMYNAQSVDIGINNSGDLFGAITGVGDLSIITSGNFTPGIWHHVAFTWDGANLRGFVDGALKATLASITAQAASVNPLTVGQNAGNGVEWLKGHLTEVRLSNIARYTSAFTPPTAQFSSDANTLALWHFSEGSGSTSADASGHSNTFTLDATNPPSWTVDGPF